MTIQKCEHGKQKAQCKECGGSRKLNTELLIKNYTD